MKRVPDPSKMKTGEVLEFRRLGPGDKLPKGYVRNTRRFSHHDRHMVTVVKVVRSRTRKSKVTGASELIVTFRAVGKAVRAKRKVRK